jgi:hypothetical protein
MEPYSSGNGCNSFVLVANTAGTQLNLVGAGAASGSGSPPSTGKLHTISFGGDSTAETISVYDGTSTGGVLKFKGITPTAGTPGSWLLDIQFNVGMFIVISGGTAVAVTVSWA